MKKIGLRIFCLCLVLFCTISSLVVSVGAKEILPFRGTGHVLDPYLIETTEDFVLLRDLVNEGEDCKGLYFLQTADLDLGSIENWIPIGLVDSENYFYGTYNGGGHVIRNLTINDSHLMGGLFGQLGGTVINLGIESGLIQGSCVGAITGQFVGSEARIINCYNKATIKGYRAGGIADYFTGGVIADCWNAGVIEGVEIGGLVGCDAKAVVSSKTFGEAPLFAPGFVGVSDLNTHCSLEELDEESLKESFSQAVVPYVTWQDQLLATRFTGMGEEDDPYLIRSVEELLDFRSMVNVGCSFADCWVRQECDLDLATIENWTSIGVCGQGSAFYGVYDGNGYTISNLRMQGEDLQGGFFGTLAGTVMNLGIESGRIEGACVGAIAAQGIGSGPMIVNCYNKATVIGSDRAGGIVDDLSGGLIVNCLNQGAVSGGSMTGGICAYGVKRMVNCFSVGTAVCDPKSEGILEASCEQVASWEEAAERLNQGMYKAANRTDYQHNNLLTWQADGGFGAPHNYLVRFVLQEILFAIVVFSVIFLIWLAWRTAKKENGIRLVGMRDTLVESVVSLQYDRKRRTAAILSLGLIFGFGMLAVSYLNNDHTVTRALFWLDAQDTFMDWINPMKSVISNNYAQNGHYTDIGATYPPIARACLWLFGQVLPSDIQMFATTEIRSGYGTALIFFAFFGCMLALVFLYRHLSGVNGWHLPIFAVLCGPMIYLIERGNIMILVLLFCTIFVAGYRSENHLVRHLAYICLGLAAAIKIYPVVLGLLVVRERRWKHVVQCVLYGLAFCILPFFFIGGIPELMLYIRNVTTSFGKNAVNVNEWLLNYTNILAAWGDSFLGNAAIGRVVGKYTLYLVTALLAGCCIFSRSHWKAVLAATLIIVLYPGYSSYYCAAFFAIPMLCLLAEKDSNGIDYVYAVSFVLLLAPLQFVCGALGVKQGTLWTFVGSVGVILALVLIVDCGISTVRWLKLRNATKQEIISQEM